MRLRQSESAAFQKQAMMFPAKTSYNLINVLLCNCRFLKQVMRTIDAIIYFESLFETNKHALMQMFFLETNYEKRTCRSNQLCNLNHYLSFCSSVFAPIILMRNCQSNSS